VVDESLIPELLLPIQHLVDLGSHALVDVLFIGGKGIPGLVVADERPS